MHERHGHSRGGGARSRLPVIDWSFGEVAKTALSPSPSLSPPSVLLSLSILSSISSLPQLLSLLTRRVLHVLTPRVDHVSSSGHLNEFSSGSRDLSEQAYRGLPVHKVVVASLVNLIEDIRNMWSFLQICYRWIRIVDGGHLNPSADAFS